MCSGHGWMVPRQTLREHARLSLENSFLSVSSTRKIVFSGLSLGHTLNQPTQYQRPNIKATTNKNRENAVCQAPSARYKKSDITLKIYLFGSSSQISSLRQMCIFFNFMSPSKILVRYLLYLRNVVVVVGYL